ncbi:MAG: LysM peptidoglycan-binding domain-containing protein [Anaerolineae bacterium]
MYKRSAGPFRRVRVVVLGLIILLMSSVLVGSLSGCRREVDIATVERAVIKAEATATPGRGKSNEAPVPAETAVLDTPTPTPTRAPPENTAVFYTVKAGDTLLRIAALYGTTTESLMRLNGLANPDQLSVGQRLQVSLDAEETGPGRVLIPDSELVYGPGFRDFDVADEIARHPGLIATYAEEVNGRTMGGAEIVDLVAKQYSVGPRVLLALLELRGGWLSNPDPSPAARLNPLGYDRGVYWQGLYFQLAQAANALNAGFHGWWEDTLWLIETQDGTFIRFSTDLNAGTAGVQKMVADTAASYDAWLDDLDSFAAIYQSLFGDPFSYAVEPLIPPGVEAPELALPWPKGETWYYTGGPHPGWGTQGAFAAVDFVTDERNIGCMVSRKWVTAAAPGQVETSEDGMVLQDLDSDGFLGTGWVLLYMHVSSQERVEAGTFVEVGDRVGHPSCEGGVSDASHLHIARRLNGVWIAADDAQWPMLLSGWRPVSTDTAYEGTLERDGQVCTACECWEAINAVTHE